MSKAGNEPGPAIKTNVLFRGILFMLRAVYDPINFSAASRDNEEIVEEAVGVAKLPMCVPRLTSRITARREYPLLRQQRERTIGDTGEPSRGGNMVTDRRHAGGGTSC